MVTEKHEQVGPEDFADTVIGIMADSHGRQDAIAAALTRFRQIGCRKIFHLGDICDSFHVGTADACVQLLQTDGVTALKGNNDHALVVVQTEAPTPEVAKETVEYLGDLPLVAQDGCAVFAHSLPFVTELGFSCMIRTPQEAEAQWFFSAFPNHVLFRGHSHDPEIRRKRNGKLEIEPLAPGRRISVAELKPCIITCGALTRRLCMIWQPLEEIVTCLALDDM